MKYFIPHLFLLFLVNNIGNAQSLNLAFKHITRSSGLPVDYISCIAQDSSGFIWLGTAEGLYRYDGFSYKNFYNIPGDLHTIPGNYISRIYVDSKGLLWIVTSRAGIAIMKNDGQVLQVINSLTNTVFGSKLDGTFDIKEDRSGLFWCATYNGLFKLKKNKDSIKVIQELNLTDYHHPTNSLGRFVLDKKGDLWLCTFKGIAIYNPMKDSLYNANNNPEQLSFLYDTAYAVANILLDEERNKLWYSTYEPATRVYNLTAKTTTNISVPKKHALRDYNELAYYFFLDSKKNIWMGTGNGVSLFSNNSLTPHFYLKDKIYGATRYGVNGICEDKEGSFWFATTDGINIAQPYNQFFTYLSSHNAQQDSFNMRGITCIVPTSDHTFLAGTNNGIYETDADFNVQKHFNFGTIDYDWIWAYYIDSPRHQVFFSTQAGMLLYSMETHSLQKLTTPPFDDHYPVSSFSPAGDGNIWMCHYRNDFFKYNPGNKTFRKYRLTELGEKPQVLRMYKDKDLHLWLLAQDVGLLRFDEQKEKIVERITAETSEHERLLQSNIMLVQDLGDALFVGYLTKGISLYNKTSKTFSHFSRADGLVSNSITDAIETRHGILWIATTNGISRFDVAKKSFINYNYSSGILENNIWMISQLPDGRIAAGNGRGMVLFNPDTIKNINYYVQPPIITNVSIYGKQITADSLFNNHVPLHISYKENYFSIDYISLHYNNNEQIEYAYQLEGLDKNWIPAGNRRFVSFANLGGGKYYFHVRAKLAGGDWAESKFVLPIYVSAAFYTQGWFYTLLAVVTASIIYAVYRFRVSQFLKLQQVRAQIASDLHDDIGSSLTSISYYSEIVKMNMKEEAGLNILLDKIGNNARNMVSDMSDIVWVINPANDEATSLVARMKNYASQVLGDRNMLYTFETDAEEIKIKLNLQRRKNIFLIYKEALNNAIKYAGCSRIAINISQKNSYFFMQVKDDGKGFDGLTCPGGNGLTNMKNRAEEIKGMLTIDTAPGNGTQIQLYIKIT